jgi:FixJ family two-component response regulator
MAQRHAGPIHLFLSDVVMPGISGPEVAKEIVKIRPEIRVVFMSGYSDSPFIQHSMAQGDAAFLQKPVMPGVLARKVREQLDAVSSPRALDLAGRKIVLPVSPPRLSRLQTADGDGFVGTRQGDNS